MDIRRSAFILVSVAVIFSTNTIAQDVAIYRWVDENNVVHFSQHQPKDDNYSQLTTVASYRAKSTLSPKTSEATSSVDEQITKYEKEQAEINAKNEKIVESNCKAAKLNLQMLNSFNQVMTTDSEGKNRALTDKEKKAQVELSKKHVELYCNNK